MAAPSISDLRIQAHLTERGTWNVRISGQVRGQYRSELHQDIEFLRVAVGQLVAGFFRRYGEVETIEVPEAAVKRISQEKP